LLTGQHMFKQGGVSQDWRIDLKEDFTFSFDFLEFINNIIIQEPKERADLVQLKKCAFISSKPDEKDFCVRDFLIYGYLKKFIDEQMLQSVIDDHYLVFSSVSSHNKTLENLRAIYRIIKLKADLAFGTSVYQFNFDKKVLKKFFKACQGSKADRASAANKLQMTANFGNELPDSNGEDEKQLELELDSQKVGSQATLTSFE